VSSKVLLFFGNLGWPAPFLADLMALHLTLALCAQLILPVSSGRAYLDRKGASTSESIRNWLR